MVRTFDPDEYDAWWADYLKRAEAARKRAAKRVRWADVPESQRLREAWFLSWPVTDRFPEWAAAVTDRLRHPENYCEAAVQWNLEGLMAPCGNRPAEGGVFCGVHRGKVGSDGAERL